jgi:ribosomal protein S18 acetylase RimI-like enzyme
MGRCALQIIAKAADRANGRIRKFADANPAGPGYDHPMEIRSATVDDVDGVLPMVRKLLELHAKWDEARFAARPGVIEGYRGWLLSRTSDPRSVFLVAQPREALAGFLIGTVEGSIPIYRVAEFGFIHDLWVEPEYRNEGLARSMTLLALERFKSIGVTQVRLETAVANEVGRSLFASCGFRVSTQEMLCEL